MTVKTNEKALPIVSLNAITNSCPYNQSIQTSDIEFSILNRVDNKAFKELHYQVRCREYLGDANVAAHLDKNTPTIYGFELKDKRMSLEESLFSLSVRKESYENLISKIHLISDLEKTLKIPLKSRTKLFGTEDADFTLATESRRKLVLTGPAFWMQSPLLVAIYTYLIRVLTYQGKGDTIEDFLNKLNIESSTDGSLLVALRKLDLIFLLKNIDDILGDDPISGLNDKYILNTDNNIFTSDHTKSIPFKRVDNDQTDSVSYGVSQNHAYHGFVNLDYKIRNYAAKNDYSGAAVGFKWAINYFKIKQEQARLEAQKKLKKSVSKTFNGVADSAIAAVS